MAKQLVQLRKERADFTFLVLIFLAIAVGNLPTIFERTQLPLHPNH